jgi:uncharacterized membrane protein
MKTKIVWIALILSLGFTLFFLTGYFKAKHVNTKAYTLQERIEVAAKRLKLDADQKIALMHIFKEIQQKTVSFKKRQRSAIKTFKNEFKKPQPNIEQLRDLLQSLEKEQKTLRKYTKQRWKDFLSTLSTQQRKAVIQMLKRRPNLYKKLILPTQ